MKRKSIFNPAEVSENEVYRFITTQYQHQNQLSWSRLQTIFAVETATLTGAFAKPGFYGNAAILLGTVIIVILYLMVIRDWQVRDQNTNLLDAVHQPRNIKLIVKPKFWWLRGYNLFGLAILSSLLANFVVLLTQQA